MKGGPFTIFAKVGAKDAMFAGIVETRETISSDSSLNWLKGYWDSMFELSEGVNEELCI